MLSSIVEKLIYINGLYILLYGLYWAIDAIWKDFYSLLVLVGLLSIRIVLHEDFIQLVRRPDPVVVYNYDE